MIVNGYKIIEYFSFQSNVPSAKPCGFRLIGIILVETPEGEHQAYIGTANKDTDKDNITEIFKEGSKIHLLCAHAIYKFLTKKEGVNNEK
jgi:hypothetical protein